MNDFQLTTLEEDVLRSMRDGREDTLEKIAQSRALRGPTSGGEFDSYSFKEDIGGRALVQIANYIYPNMVYIVYGHKNEELTLIQNATINLIRYGLLTMKNFKEWGDYYYLTEEGYELAD